jgi:uncharacterized protein YceH (UPF0502 family)
MSPAELPAGPWPALDPLERRVLGVLVEKQKTSKTADTYPMTLNALTTGSNQKSNRDPVLNLSEEEVAEALARCQKKGLAIKITGSRVDRWRHALYEVWRVDKVELAVLAELLLRGPQTEGELRTRASRMDDIDDLDVLRGVLKPLTRRNLVVYFTPEERRGAVLTHGFHEPRPSLCPQRNPSRRFCLQAPRRPDPTACRAWRRGSPKCVTRTCG